MLQHWGISVSGSTPALHTGSIGSNPLFSTHVGAGCPRGPAEPRGRNLLQAWIVQWENGWFTPNSRGSDSFSGYVMNFEEEDVD